MSHASNQVRWCQKKAEKEIKECEKKNKRKKHRGLLKIEPDIDIAKKHIEKARHNLEAIEYLLKGNFSDISASIIFYSMYHCFLAIAVKFGYESRNQVCTISLIEHLNEKNKIDIDRKYIDMLKYAEVDENQENSVIEMREELTYGIDVSIEDNERIEGLIEDCKRLIDISKEIIFA